MVRQLRAVYENGVLRPLEPVEVPEGREVELVVRLVPTPQERVERLGRLDKALAGLRQEAANYPEQWWDEYQKDLEGDRFSVPERL